ncbi:MAG: hypothetical protein ACTHQ3_20435 [Motilibacteraceae bacterium]
MGKSTVAWQLYEGLAADGWCAGYVDIDQLGMCYPPRDDDPYRHRLKGSVLCSLLPNYEAVGVQVLVVSGVLDPALGGWLRKELDAADPTFCRLVLDRQQLRRRVDERGASGLWHAVRRADEELDAVVPLGPTVRTDGLDPRQVAVQVRAHAELPDGDGRGDGTRGARWSAAAAPVSAAPGNVSWLCGTTGVGSSTVAWHVFSLLRESGRTAAMLDLRQLGFVARADVAEHEVAAANVASAWGSFAAEGATHLVLAGAAESSEDVRAYREALSATAMTVFRLRASREDLARRIHARGRGDGVRLPGDELVGRTDEALDAVAAEAWRRQEGIDAAEIADVVLESSGVAPEDLACRVLQG